MTVISDQEYSEFEKYLKRVEKNPGIRYLALLLAERRDHSYLELECTVSDTMDPFFCGDYEPLTEEEAAKAVDYAYDEMLSDFSSDDFLCFSKN